MHDINRNKAKRFIDYTRVYMIMKHLREAIPISLNLLAAM